MSQLNTKLLQILKERNQDLVLPEPPGPGITDVLLNVAGTAGTVLDTPAALLRGALQGQPVGENLSAIFNPRERITGNELLGRPRDEFSWGGLGVELLLDPLNAIGVGTLTKAGQAAKAIDIVAPRLAAAKVTGKLDEVAELTERLRTLEPIAKSGPKRSLVALDIPFGPKKSLIESQPVNDILSRTIGQPVSRIAGAITKPLKPYFSTDLGDPVLNAIRDIEKGSGRLAQLHGSKLGIEIAQQIDELVVKTGLKEDEVFDLFTLARETEEGITRLEDEILKGAESVSGATPPKTIDEVTETIEILKKNPAIAVPSYPGVLKTGNIVDDQLKAEKAILGRVETLETKIARLNEFTERLKKVPQPIAQFARQFGATLDPSFLRAAAEGTPFAKRKGVIGYLHRYLTPDGIKLLEDTKFVDELDKRFSSNFKSFKLKVTEEGLQKPRSRKLENELLVDINQFAKDYTGRNINFFENDPARIAYHYYRHLKRAEIKTNLLQALIKNFMRENVRVKGGKAAKPALLRLAKKELTLDKIIKPYANRPARITRFGDATWDAKASRKDIAKALKAAGLGKFVVSQADYKQFGKVFDAVLGTPKDFRKELMLYDQVLNVYRSALTSFFPAFAVRNLFSGIMMNIMAGVTNPKRYIEAINLVKRGIHNSQMAAAEAKAPSIFAKMKDLPIKGTPSLKAWSAQYLDEAKELYPSYAAYLRTLYDTGDLPKFLTTVATFEALSPVMKASFKTVKELPTIDGVPFETFLENIFTQVHRGESSIVRTNTGIRGKIGLSSSAEQTTFAHELFHNIFRAFFPNDLKEQMLDDLFRNFTPEELEKIVGKNISELYIKNPQGISSMDLINQDAKYLFQDGLLPTHVISLENQFIKQLSNLIVTNSQHPEYARLIRLRENIQKVRRTVGEEFLANFTGAEFLIKGLRKLANDAPQFKLMAEDIEILIGNHREIVDNYIKAIKSFRVGKTPNISKFINNYMRNLAKPKYHFDTDISANYYSTPSSLLEPEVLNSQNAEWAKLTAKEELAFLTWVDGTYKNPDNSVIWDFFKEIRKANMGLSTNPDAIRMADIIDRKLRDPNVPKVNRQLFRTINDIDPRLLDDWQVGEEITSASFASWTKSKDVAKSWLEFEKPNPVMFEIKRGEGVDLRSLYVRDLNRTAIGRYQSEAEVLVPKGMRYKIVSRETKTVNHLQTGAIVPVNYEYIVLEEIPQTQRTTVSLAPKLSQFEVLYQDGVIAGGQTQEIRDLLEATLNTTGGKIAAGYKRAAENPIEFITRGKLKPRFAPLGYEGNQNIENVVRVAHYLDKRAKGLSHVEAVASVKKYLFDYRDLTSFEKNVMRRAFLFYTWTRKNIPLMMGSLVEHPRFMSTYLRATGHMNPEASRRRPKWLPDSFHISRNNGKELAMSLGLPMEDLSRYDPEGQGLGRSFQKLLSETSPPIKQIAQIASGKNLFTGRPSEGGLTENLLSESPLSRAGSAVTRLVSPAQGMTRASTLSSLLTGVTVRSIDEKRSVTQNALADLEVRLNRMWRQGRVRKMDDYTYRTVNGEKLDQELVKKLISTQGKLRQSLKE